MTTTKTSVPYILPLSGPGASLEVAGGKGASLARLVVAGLPVPNGFHVTTAAYQAFVTANDLQPGILAALRPVDARDPGTLDRAAQTIADLFGAAHTPPDVASAIAQAYAALSGSNPVVAVRSSATAEDLPDLSFAGQQDTYLNVEGYGDVLQAVKQCWASLWTARAIGYRARQGIPPQGLSLAVVVQALVPAEAAGILFTANPINGRRDQSVLSAAWGLGEAVVGGLVTPDSLVIDRATGAVLERHTADKKLMTTRIAGAGGSHNGTREEPVPEALRRAPVLDDHAAAELNGLGNKIASLYDRPMDIEWALADGAFAIVQARPITALPEPELDPPDEWPLPDPEGTYMRGSITDFMPNPLTPLFATLGLPAINAGMGRTMTELIGGRAPFLDSYATSINDYAYLHINLGCRGWWWVLMRMGPVLPRLLRQGQTHWREVARPRYARTVDHWQDRFSDQQTNTELLDGVQALAHAMADYLTALQVDAIGTAAGTEGLFTALYDRLIRREGDPPAATLLLGSDSVPIQAEKALYDLAQWCSEQPSLAAYLLDTPAAQLASQWAAGVPEGVDREMWEGWQDRFRAHLAQYGHSIYDLDFGQPLPVDDPLPMLQALKLFLQGKGTNPHRRQRKALQAREQAVQSALARVRGLKRRLVRWSLRWAQNFALVREDSIFDIGLGYPLLRQMLHKLGRRAAASGAITEPGDIYWLTWDEVQACAQALDGGSSPDKLSSHVQHRKALWRAAKQATPPHQLPPKGRVMGVNTEAFMPVRAEEQTDHVLKGVAASSGQVTAPACILLGPGDFHRMQPGAILVAEITTPAWTPLFAMAAGVITDVGGPLSHGSIVAREYGIPAVLGTGVATQRITHGQTVTVDGTSGTVTLI